MPSTEDTGTHSDQCSFGNLTHALSQRLLELQQLQCFKIDDSAQALFAKDLQGLEANVRALEQHVADIKQAIAKETAAIPKAKALLDAAAVQQRRLQYVASNLPARLPSLSTQPCTTAAAGPAPAAGPAAAGPAAGARQAGGTSQPATASTSAAPDGARTARGRAQAGPVLAAQAAAPAAAAAAQEKRRRQPCPRWYLTQRELASLSSYMRGRLTLDKANAAVDDMAAFAEATAKTMAALRANLSGRVPAEERKYAQELFHSVAGREGIKGRFWFTENDLKGGTAIKMDKSGKAVLMVMRHLGRLQEVRCSVQGSQLTIYVLNSP